MKFDLGVASLLLLVAVTVTVKGKIITLSSSKSH